MEGSRWTNGIISYDQYSRFQWLLKNYGMDNQAPVQSSE
jgi:hypothetical protein